MELKPLGIGLVIVEPGATQTEFANTSVRKMKSYPRGGSPYAAIYARADELKAQLAHPNCRPHRGSTGH